MRNLLLLLLLLCGTARAQSPGKPVGLKEAVAEFPRSQLQFNRTGPVSLEINQGIRAGYEALGEFAGINVIFDPDFGEQPVRPFKIENADILQAFDLLSMQTNNFVEVLNSNTILVAPDNQAKRRDHGFMVLKTLYLPNAARPERLTEMVSVLRTTLNLRYIAINTTAMAILLRDTPDRVAQAEKAIGLAMPVVTGTPVATMGETIRGDHILTLDGGAIRDAAPARAGFKPRVTQRVSFSIEGNTRSIFDTLAEAAGLNVVFDPDFRGVEGHSFKVENIEMMDALDTLALQTRTFWRLVDQNIIVVAPDSQAKRRDHESMLIKTFFLPNASRLELVEIVTALRTILNARYLATITDLNAIVMRDIPGRLALAERIISDSRKSAATASSAGFATGTEVGFVQNRRAAEALGSPSPLKSRVPGRVSIDANDSARASYEAMAAMAGLRVIFDSRFQDIDSVAFKVRNVDVADALDFFSMQTRNIWQLVDNDTIIIAPDTQSVRANLLPRVTGTIRLSKAGLNVNEVVTTLRTLLNLRQISTLENSIVIQDTAESIRFAEEIVADLEKAGARNVEPR
jgi:hypothetical protein